MARNSRSNTISKNSRSKKATTIAITQDVFDQAERTLQLLVSKKVKIEEARIIANLLKVKINKMELELDHAKLTGRLKSGSPYLPNFIRS